jgi:hypothetical protein
MYASDGGLDQTGSGRIEKTMSTANRNGGRNSDVQSRLDRLELLLERAVSAQSTPVPISQEGRAKPEREDYHMQLSPSSTSQSSQGAGMSSDNQDGTLLLGEGQSQFVSSLHWSLLAEEVSTAFVSFESMDTCITYRMDRSISSTAIRLNLLFSHNGSDYPRRIWLSSSSSSLIVAQIQDIKALLGDKHEAEDREVPTPNNLVHLLSLGRARVGVTLQQLLPQSQQHRDELLSTYFSNVDPMVRLTHKPTLLRKLSYLLKEEHPLAFAIFYSAINSLPPSVCLEKFGESREDLLDRYELGVEIGCARETYLTTSSLEVLQGFVLWLTCITKEDNMGKLPVHVVFSRLIFSKAKHGLYLVSLFVLV